MRKLLMAASLAAVAATVPAVSQAADPGCATDHVGGTVIGAGIGALLGSAVAGNSSNTEGTIIGGIAGAIAGNQIAKNASNPCAPGYDPRQDPRMVNAAPVVAPAPRDYRDGRYADRDEWYDDRGGFDRNRFWAGAPASIDERVEFLERRIRRGIDNGTVTRREADRAFASLDAVRREELHLRRRGGGRLGPADRDYLQRRLDEVSQEVRWARNNGPRRY